MMIRKGATRRGGLTWILVPILTFASCTEGNDPDTVFTPDAPAAKGLILEIGPRTGSVLPEGQTMYMSVTVRDNRGKTVFQPQLEWTTSDPGIATVDAYGRVSAVREGIAFVKVRHREREEARDSATIAVTGEEESSRYGVQVIPKADTIPYVGASILLAAAVYNERGKPIPNPKFEFLSLDPGIATTTKDGVVTGKASGVARIALFSKGSSDTARVWVAPQAPTPQAASIRISPTEHTFTSIGATTRLNAAVLDANGAPVSNQVVTWGSMDPGIAIVDASGLVRSVAKGQARITARQGTISDMAMVYVEAGAALPQPVAVRVLPDADTVDVGATTRLSATVFDQLGGTNVDQSVSWSSLDLGIASVDPYGLVTGKATGIARIAARQNGMADTSRVWVVSTSTGGSGGGGSTSGTLTIQPAVDTADVGQKTYLWITLRDAQGAVVSGASATWTNLNPATASMELIGHGHEVGVTGLAAGVTRIVATTNGLVDTATVYIESPQQTPTLTISPRADTIASVGGQTTLTAFVQGGGVTSSSSSVSWSSLDPGIVDVDNGGSVTGLSKGLGRVVANSSGMADTARVWVAPDPASVTWTVGHSPSYPTTASTVTISATASNPSAIASMEIYVDGSIVKSCNAGTCSHGASYAQGSHSYSVTAKDQAGTSLTAGSGSFPVTQVTSGGGAGGSARSPHWRHMRWGGIDYRIIVGRYNLTSATAAQEWDWAASHADYSINGTESEYLARNPSFRIFKYDTFWFTPVNTAGAIENCLTANGYNIEDAYLHHAGGSKTQANRVVHQQFAGKDYWYYNVGDPGFRYCRDKRTQGHVAAGAVGLFFDTNSRSAVGKYAVAQPLLEYPSATAYWADHESLLARQSTLVPAGYNLLNQSTYFNKSDEQALARVAGGTMTEFVNAPHRDPQWDAVDALTSVGVHVDYSGQATDKMQLSWYGATGGNYASVRERVMMWNYASYLMVVQPADMELVVFDNYIDSWQDPLSSAWLDAYAHDIGLATGARRSYKSGTDAAGQTYRVYARDFENGVVLIRKQEGRTAAGSYDYSDRSAVAVDVPAGTWRLLLPDGSITGPVTTVDLRAGEAVILVK